MFEINFSSSKAHPTTMPFLFQLLSITSKLRTNLLVSCAMLMRPNKAKTALHGSGFLPLILFFVNNRVFIPCATVPLKLVASVKIVLNRSLFIFPLPAYR